MEKAQQIVTAAGLQTTAAGYLLMSCKNRDDPPYQGAIYLTFALPAGARADAYFRDVTAALVRHGWTDGLPPNDQVFGRTMSKDGVTAIIYRHGDHTGAGSCVCTVSAATSMTTAATAPHGSMSPACSVRAGRPAR
ncbi:putative lipoprotein lppJ [Mycobacterium kansasii]|uniref:Putative lipoprotein lppJ n=1 Tax=Mycobacterium kansasii TaxID=1768 RepID=A0A1V3XEL6_MYCKA|nr:putative lipoprotein lppJ [Mycobacterium kansasii]OOK77548.1 putative lipoprotein lppJ [Mycobacterium kansasii]